jgi:hypothetical protein
MKAPIVQSFGEAPHTTAQPALKSDKMVKDAF